MYAIYKSKRILIVEDEKIVSLELEKLLNTIGFLQVDRTGTGEEAIKIAKTKKPDLILMDIKLAEMMDGITSAETILHEQDVPIIFLTAYADNETIERVKLVNPYGYLLKPYKKSELEVAIQVSLYKHQVNQKLKKQEQRYRKIFEESTISSCIYNANGILERINNSACQIFGIPSQQNMIGFNINEDPIIGSMIMECIKKQQKQQFDIEYNFDIITQKEIYKTENQGIAHLQIHVIPLDSESEGAFVYIFNNTKSHDINKNLQHETELLEALMKNIPDKIYFKDTKSRFIKISHNHAKLFNIQSVNDAIGKTDFDFFSNEHAAQAFNDEQNIIKTKKPIVNIEEKETWPDGSVTYVSSSKVPVFDHQGNTIGLVGISRDITDIKRYQDALTQSEKRYKELFDEAPIGYHELDISGKILDVNNAEAEMLGYSKEEMIGQPIFDFLPTNNQEQAIANFKKKIKKESTNKPFERKYKTKSGKLIELFIQDKLVLDDSGNITGIRSTLQDISDLKKAERKLQKTANDLQRSNEELEQFAYVASHDLQEPLRMVASYVQLLEKRYTDKLDEDAKEFINFAVDGAKRMQGLINALLMYSRVGTRSKPFEEVDADKLVRQVLSDLVFKIEETKAEINIAQLPKVYADPTQLGQVFQNLIGNAIKFHGENNPKIEISFKDNQDSIQFTIKDNGIGIEEEYRERIFMVFQRLHTRQEYEGTGIGLAVCKKIVERHGGKIWTDPNPDGGSIFYFTIQKKENK